MTISETVSDQPKKGTSLPLILGGVAICVVLLPCMCGLLAAIVDGDGNGGGGTGNGANTGRRSNSKGKYAPGPTLTADFLPFKPGAEVDVRWSGEEYTQYRSSYVFKDSNTCQIRNPEEWKEGTEAYRKRTGESWFLQKKATPGVFGEIKRKVQDGYVIITDENGETYRPIKIGAKPGDRWTYEARGLRRNYSYSEYKEWDDYLTDQPTDAAIIEETEYRLGKLTLKRLWILQPHIGVHSINESDPVSDRTTKSIWTTPNLLHERTAAEQVYFD
ncbi:hypothetical protein [Anatilimnocola floriformis]|uniref:hypothetical protein n=1 Tax=Anatilimnocola floriformis TaxID=2948575 RepID=UPI0020C2A736|nr:hypothetical protein [Anatilimnocola floriformis]